MKRKIFTILLLTVFTLTQFSFVSAETLPGSVFITGISEFANPVGTVDIEWTATGMTDPAQNILIWSRVQNTTEPTAYSGCFDAASISEADASSIFTYALYTLPDLSEGNVVEFIVTIDSEYCDGAPVVPAADNTPMGSVALVSEPSVPIIVDPNVAEIHNPDISEEGPFAGGPQQLNGTFIGLLPRTSAQRSALFTYLTSVGMNTIIIQSTSERKCTELVNYGPPSFYPSGTTDANIKTYLQDLLKDPNFNNIHVYVGLGFVRPSTTPSCALSYTKEERDLAIADINLRFAGLKQICHTYPTCKGWYLADEPNLATARTGTILNPLSPDLILYYQSLVNIIRQTSSKDILISPHLFYGTSTNPNDLAYNAKDFKTRTGVTIQLWQDSIGTNSTDLGWRSDANLNEYYTALSSATTGIGQASLWAVTEIFNNGPLGKYGVETPASIRRVRKQLDLTYPYATKHIAWTSAAFMSNVNYGDGDPLPEAPRLLASYKALYGYAGVETLLTPSYYWSTPPSGALDSGSEMFNKMTGDPKYPTNSEWVSVNASTYNGSQLILTFPASMTTTINWVGIHMLYNNSKPAYIPNSIKLDCMDTSPYTPLAEWLRPSDITNTEVNGEYVFGNTSALNKSCDKIALTLTGNTGWHFLSEIEIVGHQTTP